MKLILSILGYMYNNVYAYVCASFYILYSFLLRMTNFFFNTDLTDWTEQCPVAIEEIKKFVAFPWAYALAARCVCSST